MNGAYQTTPGATPPTTTTPQRHDLSLPGCHPAPLSSYLKALGVLRLVAEQVDPDASGFWRADQFVLRSSLDAAGLTTFLLSSYVPSPLVAPWNGGSGFGRGDNRDGFEALQTSTHPRFAPYRAAITAGLAARRQLGIATGVDDAVGVAAKVDIAQKPLLLEQCRATLPEAALPFLDAAVLLTNDRPRYPPLLGTGGNDGRLDFTNNFMQRLVTFFDPDTGTPTAAAAAQLDGALFGGATHGLLKGKAVGQFTPGAAGGANQGVGFTADSLLNAWDFILLLEGAITMAGSVSRKLGDAVGSKAAFPFTVNPSSAGVPSGTDDEEASSRGEMWLPLWEQPIRFTELRSLLGEGRARVGRSAAHNGVDFARAVSSLGVARGLSAFERVGFQNRNGKAFFAVPQGRYVVQDRPEVRWLEDISAWLDRFRRFARDKTAPASARRALRRLEDAVLGLCQQPSGQPTAAGLVGDLLHALADTERSLWRGKLDERLRPIPALRTEWARAANDGSLDYRLGSAFAASWGPLGKTPRAPLRHSLSPTQGRMTVGQQLRWRLADRDVVKQEAGPLSTWLAVLQRRLLAAASEPGDTWAARCGGSVLTSLADVAAFIDGRCDDQRVLAWARALSLVAWPSTAWQPEHVSRRRPDARHAQLALCFASGDGVTVPMEARIARLAAAGRGDAAVTAARRRLRSAGLAPLMLRTPLGSDRSRRMAAALLLPLSVASVAALTDRAVRPGHPDTAI